jgi:hypothetical protein
MGVTEGVIWLAQAISGALKTAEITYEGYKMGTKFVVADGN